MQSANAADSFQSFSNTNVAVATPSSGIGLSTKLRRKSPDRFPWRHDLGTCSYGNAQQRSMPRSVVAEAFHRLLPLGLRWMSLLETLLFLVESTMSSQAMGEDTR